MVRLLVEAVAVGLTIVVVGTPVSLVVGRMMGTDLPPVCKDWNKNYIMEISLFLTGVVTHLLFNFGGIGK